MELMWLDNVILYSHFKVLNASWECVFILSCRPIMLNLIYGTCEEVSEWLICKFLSCKACGNCFDGLENVSTRHTS